MNSPVSRQDALEVALYFNGMCDFAIDAYVRKNTRDLARRFDGKTPFFVHPLGMMTAILNDDTLDFKTRANAALVALLHDVLEDTSITEVMIREAHEDYALDAASVVIEIDFVLMAIRALTAESSAASQAKFMAAPQQAGFWEVLVRAADIADNVLTFEPDKARSKIEYMQALLARLPSDGLAAWRLRSVLNRVATEGGAR